MSLTNVATDDKKPTFFNKKIILGFSLPVFGLIVLLVLMHLAISLQLHDNKLTVHPLITSLLIAMLLAAFLQTIGKITPLLKDIGGGAILCIIIPSILFTVPMFKKYPFLDIMQKKTLDCLKHLSGIDGVGFISFFVSALIIGSFLGMDKKLLKNSFKKFIPLVLISLITGVLVVGILGYFLKPIAGIAGVENDTSKGTILDAIFYIFAPLASGGITAGIIPLSEAYSSKNTLDMKNHIVPALLLGGIFSILVSGIIKKLFGNSKFSGNGKLEISDALPKEKENQIKQTTPNFTSTQFSTGLVAIFSLYIFSALIKDSLKILFPNASKYFPDTIVFIIFIVVFIKLFNLISQYYVNCIVQTSKTITVNLTSTLLVVIGSSLDITKALKHLININFIITCFSCVIVVACVAGYFGKKFGYYPLESSITAGLCTNSIGGAGHVAILSAADLMGLIPFTQVARIGGALVVVIASIVYPLIYN